MSNPRMLLPQMGHPGAEGATPGPDTDPNAHLSVGKSPLTDSDK